MNTHRQIEVLLIEPPSPPGGRTLRILGSMGRYKTDMAWPPLDLMIIDGLLEKESVTSTIFDANATDADFQDIREIIKRYDPKLVVFTTSTSTIYTDLLVAKQAKLARPTVLVAAIGTHIMVLPEETLNSSQDLDMAIFNEPELVILDLIKNNYCLERTEGICFRRGGRIIRGASRASIEDLDFLGFPSHHKLNLNLYHDPLIKRRPMTITYGQRGCINACIYCCSGFYSPMRKRGIENLIRELKWIESLGIKEVRFFDPGLTNDLEWARSLFERMIKENIDLSWSCEARADCIDFEIALLMKRAGCNSVDMGVETGDEEILKRIKKNVTKDVIREAVRETKEAGLEVMLHFMFGLPGETKQTLKKTVDFAKELDPDMIVIGIATPHPGTPFFQYLKREGFLKTTDWSRYDPIYEPVYDYPQIGSGQIYTYLRRAYREFYLRPGYIIKRLRKINNLTALRQNLRNFFSLIKRFLI